MSRHHRKPKSICTTGKNDKKNISIVPQDKHRLWHRFASNHEASVVCSTINAEYLDPAHKYICVRSFQYEQALDLLKKYLL